MQKRIGKKKTWENGGHPVLQKNTGETKERVKKSEGKKME